MRLLTLALLASLTFAAGCTIGAPRDNRAKTPHESCMAACNRDFDICMDESSNSRETMQGAGRLQSAGTGCSISLKSCQNSCRAL